MVFIDCSLSANLAGPTALLDAFAVVQQEMQAAEGDEGHLATWLAGQHSMQDTAAEIDRLMQVCCDGQISTSAAVGCFGAHLWQWCSNLLPVSWL